MCNVFALFLNSEGQAEEVNLGSLYVRHDDRGLISHIEIEPYDPDDLDEYEPHFDKFDRELPEVPLRVHLGPEEAWIDGFFDAERTGVDFEEFEEGRDNAFLEEACKQYESILKAAYRLYERTVRAEPVFVGYIDFETHEKLGIEDILEINPPLFHFPARQQRELKRTRRHQQAIEARQALCRVTLRAIEEALDGFPGELVLHVSARPEGFPYRFSPISGLADAQRPLAIMENGDMRLGDGKAFFTNLMSTRMAEGEKVVLWTDHCRSSQVFRIVKIESFLGSETAEI